jgi:hypothetical protein
MSNEDIKLNTSTPEGKKAYMKEYMREYMKKYRKNNTEMYEKEKKYVAIYLNNRYNTDPEFREKKNKKNLENYHKKRQQMLANPISI